VTGTNSHHPTTASKGPRVGPWSAQVSAHERRRRKSTETNRGKLVSSLFFASFSLSGAWASPRASIPNGAAVAACRAFSPGCARAA
jgi:hypothetical protein